MKNIYKRVLTILVLTLLLVTTVSADGTSILDNDRTTEMSGIALVMCSVAVFVFAALIIIRIIINGSGN